MRVPWSWAPPLGCRRHAGAPVGCSYPACLPARGCTHMQVECLVCAQLNAILAPWRWQTRECPPHAHGCVLMLTCNSGPVGMGMRRRPRWNGHAQELCQLIYKTGGTKYKCDTKSLGQGEHEMAQRPRERSRGRQCSGPGGRKRHSRERLQQREVRVKIGVGQLLATAAPQKVSGRQS